MLLGKWQPILRMDTALLTAADGPPSLPAGIQFCRAMIRAAETGSRGLQRGFIINLEVRALKHSLPC